MVDLLQWVPYLTWGLLAAGVILLFVVVGKVIPYLRTLVNRFDPEVRGDKVAMEVEGIWYYLAEILHVIQFVIVALVAISVVQFFMSRSSVVVLFDSTLGTYVIPIVLVTFGIFAFKTLPWFASGRARGRAAEGQAEQEREEEMTP
jgi:hypothetical protein